MAYDEWLSSSLDEEGLPVENVRVFSVDSPAIYYAKYMALPVFTECEVTWYYEGEIIEEDWPDRKYEDSYFDLFISSLTRPENGFKPGTYAVTYCYAAKSDRIVFWVIDE
jgi:hypothetical protein